MMLYNISLFLNKPLEYRGIDIHITFCPLKNAPFLFTNVFGLTPGLHSIS